MTRDALRNMDKSLAAADVLLLGASYREDVGDTRYSGSEIIVRKLTEMGAELRVHDPYVAHWWEFESQDSYPSKDHSLARFFRNQEKLAGLRVTQDLDASLTGADAVIFAVRHKQYLDLDPDTVVKKIGKPAAIIDCFAILDDAKIQRYFELGCEVKGLGRGHVNRIKKAVLAKKKG
jgi:UDP-N-acetyl-D-mannosaminuronate dehydrogenase